MLEFVRDDIVCRLAINVERERINIEHIRHIAAYREAPEARIAKNATSLVCRIKKARSVAAGALSPITNIEQQQDDTSICIHIRWRAEKFGDSSINAARTRRRCFLKRPDNSIHSPLCHAAFPFCLFNIDITELSHTA